MKRLAICLILIIILPFCLMACDETSSVVDYEIDTSSEAPFQLVRKTKNAEHTSDNRIEDVQYYVEINTQLMYIYFIDWDANATRGGLCPLYNTDGTIMTYEQFQENYAN